MPKHQMSYAVVARRYDPLNSEDDFPTPPWAVRALMEHTLSHFNTRDSSALEPAAGRGYMARTLKEYFYKVYAFDKYDYGFCIERDFLTYEGLKKWDWIITNPPFNKAEEFVHKALPLANVGVAIFARTSFLEGVRRYNKIFSTTPPNIVAQFSERVPIVRGRVDPKATSATSYAWFVWVNGAHDTKLRWIPPCRKALEQEDDYEAL